MKTLTATLAISLVAGTGAAQGFTTPDSYGWSRGVDDSSYFGWDDLTSVSGGNVPDLGSYPSPLPAGWATPDVFELSGNGFVTSTGNIYSFSGPIEIEVVAPAAPVTGGTTTVLLQTRTQGREIDASTVNCDGVAPSEVVELYRFNLGPDGIGGGYLVETLWRFEVPADGTVVIGFESDGESMSLDSVVVDTFSEEGSSCLADVNGDGSVTPADFSAWVAAFNAQSAGCDQNGDGACSPADFSAWVSNFNAGC